MLWKIIALNPERSGYATQRSEHPAGQDSCRLVLYNSLISVAKRAIFKKMFLSHEEVAEMKPLRKWAEQHFWDSYFQVYDELNKLTGYQQMLKSVSTIALADRTDDAGQVSWLDINCGTGNLFEHLTDRDLAGGQKQDIAMFGTDLNSSALAINARKNPQASLILNDASQGLPYKQDSFSLITITNGFYVLKAEDQAKLAEEIKRVLKKGGKVIIADPKPSFSYLSVFIDNLVHRGLSSLKDIWTMIKILRFNRLIDQKAQAQQFHYLNQDEFISLFKSKDFELKQFTETYSGQCHLLSLVKK
ncbi:MAG: class I SAM-dependent methyltransferase [Candidatus Margulisiibacteriota bacterium]|jgi:ubiquinone/menaquinone biosynthesis C-methylase UbiE